MSDLSTLGASWPQLSGTAQFSLLAWTTVGLLTSHGLLVRWAVPVWVRGVALVLALPACLLAAWWARGTFGDLGLLSLAALAVAAWRALARPAPSLSRDRSQCPERSMLTLALAAVVALLGWVLYANLLGLGEVDLYAWGNIQHGPTRQAMFDALGHANMWVLLLDPFAVLMATGSVLKGAWATRRTKG